MPAHVSAIIQCVISILYLIYVLSVCIQLVMEKYRPSYFLLMAWAFFFLGIVLHILMLLGAIPPGIISEISLRLSIIVMIALFPIALIDNYSNMKTELENMNRELEEKIFDRTRELFLSEIWINAYIKMFNEFSGVKQDFVDANSIQNYLDNVGATSLDLLTLDIGLIADLDELVSG